MKQKNGMRIALSVLLVLSMVLGIVGCGGKTATVSDAPKDPQLSAQQPDSSDQPSQKEELTREEKEQITDLLSDGTIDPGKLSDKELDQVVQDLTAELEKPAPEVEFNSGAYDENGAMKEPFDQVYPELVEKGEVQYDDESLLVKLASDRVTDGLKSAGVAALECIVPMEEYSWYEAKLISGTDAQKALAQLRELKEVKLAEYNYQIKTTAIDQYQEFEEYFDLDKNQNHNKQWHMHHFGIPEGYKDMTNPGGSPSVVVAVIDTGVDYDHEDLSQNIWVNANEIPNNGVDDDQNGYVDDYYGVNIVDGKGSGDDDNGHGTHVAGIIAAQDNKLGIVGIAYNVKVMPIKAAMSSGYLQQSDIAKAVLYAYENGAEIINMSFGGSSCSIAVQDALATAYTRCVLVASAGNDGKANEPSEGKPVSLPNYPAALTYVLGVMSVDQTGRESVFTNYDVKAFNGIEYELYAPGENIISTIPGDRYGQLSGTSMAAPVVSAMAAILRSEFSDRELYPTKFIYGQLASTSDHNANCCDPKEHGDHNLPKLVNLHMALTKTPVPEVNLHDYAMFDTVGFEQDTNGVNNGNGVVDAGETIAVGLTLRNRWGMSKNTLVSIDTLSMAGIADPYITILNPTVDYGSVGTYSTQDCGRIYTDELLTGWEDPFYIQIAKDCPNDYIFRLNVTIQCENALAQEEKASHKEEKIYTTTGTITLTVRNGVVLPAVIEEDMVLTADSLYIIPNSTVILEGVTVRVEPGTHIQFWSDDADDPYGDSYIAYLLVNGSFLVEGTKENPVYIYPSDRMSRYGVEIGSSSTGYVSLKYAEVTNLAYYYYATGGNHTGTGNHIDLADHCTFRNYDDSGELYYRYLEGGVVATTKTKYVYIGNIHAVDCVFDQIAFEGYTNLYGKAERCVFVRCGIDFKGSYENCVFLGNAMVDQTGAYYNSTYGVSSSVALPSLNAVYYCKETGTTYAAGNISAVLLEACGGKHAIMETEAEWQWIKSKLPTANTYGFGIVYNGEQYVWSDGSEIGRFMADEELVRTWEKGKTLRLSKGALTLSASQSYALYEFPGYILPTEITFAQYVVTLDTATTYQLVPQNKPVQLPLEAFVYESSNESVVQVSETGLVTPVGKGIANVYVYSSDRAVYNYVTFNITDYVPLEQLRFPIENLKLGYGSTATPGIVIEPENSTRKFVTYTSSDETVATVDELGHVTAVGFGKAVITAKAEDLEAHLPVEVCLDALFFADSEMEVAIGDTKTKPLPYQTEPAGTQTSILTFTSSDETIVKVDENGILTGVAAGTATVTVSYGELSAQITVKVYNETQSLSLENGIYAVALDVAAMELPTYDVVYSWNSEPKLQWSIKDPTIAGIENDQIVPVAEGKTELVLTDTRSGLEAVATLYVTKQTASPAVELYPISNDEDQGTSVFAVLMENGDLYRVEGGKEITRTLWYTNVKDFDCSGECHMVLFQDGTVYIEDPELDYNYSDIPKQYNLFQGREPKGVACYAGQYFVYMDYELYAWGYNNDNGQLGSGDTWYVSSPQSVYLEWNFGAIGDVITVKGMTFIQNTMSDLYMLGGDFIQQLTPKRIAKNATIAKVSGTVDYREVIYFVDDDSTGESVCYRFTTTDPAPVQDERLHSYGTVHFSEQYAVHMQYERYDATNDRYLYQLNIGTLNEDYFDGWHEFRGVNGLTAVCVDNQYLWAMSADGILYQINPEKRRICTALPFANLDLPAPKLQLTGTNLTEDNVIQEHTLKLEFNMPLYFTDWKYNGQIAMYCKSVTSSGWSSVTANATLTGNALWIQAPWNAGTTQFRENYDYQIWISDTNKGQDNACLEETIYITFTYQAPTLGGTETPDITPDTTPDVTVEVHESVLDATIQRIHTVASLTAELNRLQEEKQINTSFYGNVILNPIATDTNVNHWLRPIAQSVTAGTYTEIPLGGNYWGTVNETAIGLQLTDYTDFITYARLMYAPYLTEAPENTFPFVTAVTLWNQDGQPVTVAGNEEITFRVTFNRDMDTSIPLQVRFGSAYPYGDYQIEGQYVDARTWEGTYTIKTIIDNGYQYLTISNGCSATDDLELQLDQYRFFFEIDTTAAQALIMQGTAEDTGISLRWTQDDFDTLMGYNVYRSTAEDGLYTKLNATVIPADQMAFFDETVEPGQIYYYNFTVVKTDLTESEPSGKIVIMSKDTMAPNIYHSGVANAFTGSNLVVTATVTDNLSIIYAELYYRMVGETDWKIIRMNDLNDKYSAIIPAQHVTTAGIEYYIDAFDGVSHTYKGTADSPYTIVVQEAVDVNSLGDVDGDGIITNLDALLLLYAINDKYNLTAEEFARADLNSDGELWAAEALRILQYVSGVVGSVKM